MSVVDAPVSGGGRAAEAGNLLVMVGGDEETVAACHPVFGTYGDPVVHLGPLGSGQVTKLLNNLLFTANLATSADTLALGKSLGVDADRLAEVITNGSANSFALGRVASAGGLGRIAAHAGNVLVKDVALVDGLAAGAGARSEVVQATAHATLRLMGLEQ